MTFLLWMLLISVAINLLMFIPAYLYQTDKLTDLSYAITFIIVALTGYIWSQQTDVHLIALMLIIIWALRLGTFLFIRIRKMSKDTRFDDMRNNFIKFLRFWILQGVSVFIILIPSILLWHQSATKFSWITGLGLIVFVIGLSMESIADIQKYQFRKKKLSKWIDAGIWRISRHPNYLGEIIIWLGIYLFAVSSLSPNQKIIALIGPIYIAVLLIFVSGIPLLEKSADKKWGDEKDYQDYKNKVPTLLPSISSLRRLFR
jgi:steroid 5-alpha reductase family enzyme